MYAVRDPPAPRNVGREHCTTYIALHHPSSESRGARAARPDLIHRELELRHPAHHDSREAECGSGRTPHARLRLWGARIPARRCRRSPSLQLAPAPRSGWPFPAVCRCRCPPSCARGTLLILMSTCPPASINARVIPPNGLFTCSLPRVQTRSPAPQALAAAAAGPCPQPPTSSGPSSSGCVWCALVTPIESTQQPEPEDRTPNSCPRPCACARVHSSTQMQYTQRTATHRRRPPE
ncbi:hypothetical protein BC628DRAFT_67191 [Trametes gibbosa]|nr:hypothetical protein BC628DRAFT_67191 [Trametes gibbosa]